MLEEQDPESTRKGIFTTGLVSIDDDHRIALFMTSNSHAGENLMELLRHRTTRLSPPIQMWDAASRNAIKEFESIMANCMDHARRQFVEIVDRFPEGHIVSASRHFTVGAKNTVAWTSQKPVG